MPTSAKPAVSAALAEFGGRVRQRRIELDLSQEGLAEGTALHWSYIGRVERGQVNATLHNILRIADVLEIDPGTLLKGLQAPAPEPRPTTAKRRPKAKPTPS
ncbi:helix-turn-helix transcriptional regulator [Nocardioides sp. C4-1]|uniref:helix-turn-helix domain-containing protein n=1 Tax=Nocardioides sp. C4-1 TaxID=3151851 RepID=UPI003264BCD5